MENNTDLFEIATRERYRYPYHGLISTEDLWMLTQEDLDYVYKQLKDEQDNQSTNSLMRGTTADPKLENKIEIVRYIFEFKETLKQKKIEAARKAEKKQKILEIMARKQDEDLAGKTTEELNKMLEEL